ncbi:derlin, partial [Haematococcus lacustris]
MPPRIVTADQAGGGFLNWYQSVPPITRYMATAMLVTTVAVNLGVIPPMWLALMWPNILKKFEVWRLVTHFLVLGKLSLNFVVHMLWVLQYSAPLEQQTYQFEPADYVWMLIIVGGLCTAVAAPLEYLFNGIPLIMAIIYVWSKNFPESQVQSFYLPFAFAAISLLLGQSPVPAIIGIVAGHIYYFLKDVYPLQSGRDLIKTPSFLKQWLADAGLRGAAPPPRQAAGQPHGFTAFRGPGRRLGGE